MSKTATPTTRGAIRTQPWTRGNRLVGFDPEKIRMWIGGQRMHHGTTGIALAATALLGVTSKHFEARRALVLTLAASAMVAHDWKDRSLWFRFGPQAD
ncbi:MAG: hypothetical protein QOD60_959 [Solirubrobacterales bacterium]|nr:hypothetical protein [Solirubrobacterales bacterium]